MNFKFICKEMKKTSRPKNKNNLKHLLDTKTYFVGNIQLLN